MPWTFLRPSSFMSNALRWIPQLRDGDVVREAFGDVRVAAVDPHDIASVAIEALFSTEHVGRSYRLTGPEALSAADRIRVLGGVLRRALRFEPMSDADARADMSGSMPAEYVEAFLISLGAVAMTNRLCIRLSRKSRAGRHVRSSSG